MKSVDDDVKLRIVDVLKRVFPEFLTTMQTVIVQKLDDGISNDNYLVEYKDGVGGGGAYVLRLPGAGSAGMVNRMTERHNMIAASRLGITPEVVYFNPETSVKVMPYVDGAETLHNDTVQEHSNIDQMTRIMRTLHRSHLRFRGNFNPFEEIYRYERLLSKANGMMYEGYEGIRERLFALEDELDKMGVETVSCHCDTLPENWIKDRGGQLWLLDWEYSGMNEIYWDLAAPLIEAGFTENNENYLIDSYFDGSVPAVAARKILIYKILMDGIWSIWARVKEMAGIDYHAYGVMRLERCVKNLGKL